MDTNGIHIRHHTQRHHQPEELAVARGNTSENDWDVGVHTPNRLGGELDHLRETEPSSVQLEVPVRQVVRFIPKNDSFNHWQQSKP